MRKPFLYDRARCRALWFPVLLAAWSFIGGCSQEPPRTLTIAYSNNLNGEIRSCGCASKDEGGQGRRATLVNVARDSTENFLLVDAGDFFGREVNYGREKAELTMKTMSLMGYHGIAVGDNEFGFGLDYITRRVDEIGLPVLAANVYNESDSLLFPASWTINYDSGLTVGLIGVFGNGLKLPPQLKKGQIRITDPLQAVRREVAAISDEVDLIVVIAHAYKRDGLRIAKEVPEVDLVFMGHDGKPMRKIRRVGNAFLLEIPEGGRRMGLAFAVLDNKKGIKRLDNQIVPLSDYFEDDEGIAKLFRAYDLNVATKERSSLPPAVFAARNGLKKPFTASEACRDCHEEAFAVWAESRHATAFDILETQSRQYDRDCIPCHTTGFYKRGGFEHLAVTPELIHVGCESCHGNGHDHIKDPDTPMDADAMGVCVDCHNQKMSPEFDAESYWDKIRH
jgi:hypothetical protein